MAMEQMEQPEEQPPREPPEQLEAWYPEYFVLDTQAGDWMVSREAAAAIERVLDRWPRPVWLRFVDVTGARVRLRTRLVRALRQSTVEQRALWRRWKQERQQESHGEPPDWEVQW